MKPTRQRISELRRVFKQVDEEGTELLDKAGLGEALTLIGYEHVDLDAALKLVGRQEEACVIFEDFKEIVLDLESKPDLKAEVVEDVDELMEHAFQLMADPELGGITLSRIQQLAKTQGHDWTQQDLKDMMTVGDSDYNGLITQDGFARIWKRTGL